MLSDLCQKRREYHDAMRHQQIQLEMARQRSLLSYPPPGRAKQVLLQSLRRLKGWVQGDEAGELMAGLVQFRCVAQHYDVGETLVSGVWFGSGVERVRRGVVPVECSWAELFCCLAAVEDEPRVQEQLVRVISCNLCQLRNGIGKIKGGTIAILQDIVNKVPYGYSQTRDFQLWVALCDLFAQTLYCADLLGCQQSLLVQQSPLLQSLFLMAEDPDFLIIAGSRISFLQVSLLALYLLKRQNIQYEQINQFRRYLSGVLTQSFCFESIPEVRSYQFIRVFVLGGGRFQPGSIVELQRRMSLQTQGAQSLQPKYFQMLNCIMCFHSHILSIQSVAFLVRFIFGRTVVGSLSVEVGKTKKWMILVLRRQLANRREWWSREEVELLLKVWSDSQDSLLQAVREVKESGGAEYSALLYLMARAVVQTHNAAQIVQTILRPLGGLREFLEQIVKSSESEIVV